MSVIGKSQVFGSPLLMGLGSSSRHRSPPCVLPTEITPKFQPDRRIFGVLMGGEIAIAIINTVMHVFDHLSEMSFFLDQVG